MSSGGQVVHRYHSIRRQDHVLTIWHEGGASDLGVMWHRGYQWDVDVVKPRGQWYKEGTSVVIAPFHTLHHPTLYMWLEEVYRRKHIHVAERSLWFRSHMFAFFTKPHT